MTLVFAALGITAAIVMSTLHTLLGTGSYNRTKYSLNTKINEELQAQLTFPNSSMYAKISKKQKRRRNKHFNHKSSPKLLTIASTDDSNTSKYISNTTTVMINEEKKEEKYNLSEILIDDDLSHFLGENENENANENEKIENFKGYNVYKSHRMLIWSFIVYFTSLSASIYFLLIDTNAITVEHLTCTQQLQISNLLLVLSRFCIYVYWVENIIVQSAIYTSHVIYGSVSLRFGKRFSFFF